MTDGFYREIEIMVLAHHFSAVLKKLPTSKHEPHDYSKPKYLIKRSSISVEIVTGNNTSGSHIVTDGLELDSTCVVCCDE